MDWSALGASIRRAQPGRAAGGGDEAGNAEQKGKRRSGKGHGKAEAAVNHSPSPHGPPRVGDGRSRVGSSAGATGKMGFKVILFPASFLDEIFLSPRMERCKG